MDSAEKLLLGSILIIFLLYLSALPFVQQYEVQGTPNMHHEERALAAGLQMTASFGLLIALVLLLILYRLDRRWRILERL